MNKYLAFLCGFLLFNCLLIGCSQGKEGEMVGTPIYQESDLPIKLYLKRFHGAEPKYVKFSPLPANFRGVVSERWTTDPPDAGKKKLKEGIDYQGMELEIVRYYCASKEEALAKTRDPLISGTGAFYYWEDNPFTRELTQLKIADYIVGLKGNGRHIVICVKNNILLYVRLQGIYESREKFEKFVRSMAAKGKQVKFDYSDYNPEIDFISFLKKIVSQL